MSTVSNNKKFINLDGVRVYYNRKDNTIELLSTDEDLAGKPFKITLNVGTESETSLRELLAEHGVISNLEEKSRNIPKFAPHPYVAEALPSGPQKIVEALRSNAQKIIVGEMRNIKGKDSLNVSWDKIPLGQGVMGKEIFWDTKISPHMLLVGSTGSGKSIMQRNIILHCLKHSDEWRFIGVDMKRIELQPYAGFTKTVLGIGTNLEDGLEMVRYAKKLIATRYAEMEVKGINHFKELINPETGKPPYSIMLMVDEASMFMSPEGISTDEGKMRDELHYEAAALLGDIARTGSAAGVHLVLATQRPDAIRIKSGFNGEFINNFGIRIVAGKMGTIPSTIVLGSDIASFIDPTLKGRAIVYSRGNVEEFQMYYSSHENVLDVLNIEE